MTELIETPEDLEEAIFKPEEMQDSILDNITKVQTFIEMHTRRQTRTISVPTSTTIVSDNDTPLLDVNSQQSKSISPSQEEGVFHSIVNTIDATATSQVTNSITISVGQDVTEGSTSHGVFRSISFLQNFTAGTVSYSSRHAPPHCTGATILIPVIPSLVNLSNIRTYKSLLGFSTSPLTTNPNHEVNHAAS